MEIPGLNLKKFAHCSFLEGAKLFSCGEKPEWEYLSFSSKDEKHMQDMIFNFVGIKTDKSEIDPAALGKMFFTKTANVPRYKVREIKDKHNLSVVRDSSKADTIVISKNEMSDNIRHSWGIYVYPRASVKTMLEGMHDGSISLKNHVRQYRFSTYIQEIIDNKTATLDALECFNKIPEDVEYIAFSYGGKDKFDSIAQAHNFDVEFKSNVKIVEPEIFNNLVIYKGKNVVTDSALQSILGSSGIEHENYVFIDQLLSSSDPGNIELGLTLMANCNFEESQHYLLILLGDHYPKHRYVKYCQSVAFKSLLDFMDFNKYSNVTLDMILDKADSLGRLTDEIKDLVFKRAMGEFEHSFRRYKWIKVNGITIEKPKNDTNQGGN